jgi:hypothetical protein
MTRAMEMVSRLEKSCRGAATTCNVPRSTLLTRLRKRKKSEMISNGVEEKTKSGETQLCDGLNDEQEREREKEEVERLGEQKNDIEGKTKLGETQLCDELMEEKERERENETVDRIGEKRSGESKKSEKEENEMSTEE